MKPVKTILLMATALGLLSLNAQTLNMSSQPPAPVQNISAPISGTAGTVSGCYYVVANFIGGSLRSAPRCISNIPGTLSGSNYVKLSWPAVPFGFGVTYDVLKTAVNVKPVQGASIGLATGLTVPTYNDQGGGLSPYTLAGYTWQNASGFIRVNSWDYAVPAIESIVNGGAAFLAQVPLVDGNLGLQAHGPAANIGIEMLGKGTGGFYWDNTLIYDGTAAALNQVYSVEKTLTLAQVNAGFTLVAGATGRTLKVVHALIEAAGSLAVCTDVRISDTAASPVDATTTTAGTLADGVVTDETISGVTIGTFGTPLTAGKGLQVRQTGSACTTSTAFLVIVFYKVNS